MIQTLFGSLGEMISTAKLIIRRPSGQAPWDGKSQRHGYDGERGTAYLIWRTVRIGTNLPPEGEIRSRGDRKALSIFEMAEKRSISRDFLPNGRRA